jgi:hypothetical protein
MTANGTASFNVKASLSDNPIRWLIVGGALLIAAIAIGTTIMAGNFRERALDNSKRELENTVLLLSRHFDQQLEDFGAVQNGATSINSSRTSAPFKTTCSHICDRAGSTPSNGTNGGCPARTSI